jgi:UDP-N-acetyl-2-amino-2-deoxyglucuronate dehydrogenase
MQVRGLAVRAREEYSPGTNGCSSEAGAGVGKRLRLGVVGCGAIAEFMARMSRRVPQVRLAACRDSQAQRAGAFARRHGIERVFDHFEQMLAAPDVDAVYLAVPHDVHYEMILAAIQAGKPVLVEKPLTRTLAEGIDLVERVLKLGARVGVNYQYRYDPGCYCLAQAVRAGELGAVRSIRINVPWRRDNSYFDEAPWHRSIARAGGGTLITQGSHFLDLALWALGDPPVSAMGYIGSPGFEVEVDTLAQGIVETSGGTLVQIASSMVAASDQEVTIEVYGERGTGIYRSRAFPHARFTGARPRRRHPPERGVHALQRSLAGFARWILDGRPFLVPAHEALPVLAAVDAIYRSAHSGKRERIATP